MKAVVIAIAAFVITAPAFAADGPSQEVIDKITAKLTEMECQMDPKDIEVEDDGYELDDVICKGGNQFDIELDRDLNETGRRAE